MRSFYTITLNRLSTSRHCEIRIYDNGKFYKKLYHNRVTVVLFTGYYSVYYVESNF